MSYVTLHYIIDNYISHLFYYVLHSIITFSVVLDTSVSNYLYLTKINTNQVIELCRLKVCIYTIITTTGMIEAV